jgi:hypothetical protein
MTEKKQQLVLYKISVIDLSDRVSQLDYMRL